MHSFGNSFGFRRSAEFLHSGPQTARIPSTLTTLLQGDLVTLDPASGDTATGLGGYYLKKAAANSPIVPGVTGLLVQYEEFITSDEITRTGILNTRDLSRTRAGQLANIVTGAGIKIWLNNLTADTRTGYKQYSAETRVTLTGIAVGDTVGWDGSVYVKTTDATRVVGTVTRLLGTTGIEVSLAR